MPSLPPRLLGSVPAPVFVEGVPARPGPVLDRWLAAHAGDEVRLPFTVWRGPLGDVVAAAVGVASSRSRVRLIDTALGIPLRDRLAGAAQEPCVALLSGLLEGDVFQVRAFHGLLPSDATPLAAAARRPEDLAIRALRPLHCARGPDRCDGCRRAAAAPRSPRLLDLAPDDPDRVARPVTEVVRDGRAEHRPFDAIRTFADAVEAREFAATHGVRDVEADLWERAAAVTRDALAAGALEPIHTAVEVVEERGIAFEVRVVAALANKPRPSAGNPFADPEPALTVEPWWPPAHRIVLNKYPVIERHLLIVTAAFEDQDDALSAADFAALDAALAEGQALAFYNGGATAGASQRHKHLQIVPFASFPTERLLDGPLPFVVLGAERPEDPSEAAATCAAMRARHPGPYNLLATAGRLWFVPRSTERWQGLSINALGFAGSLLVPDRTHLDAIRRAGPLDVLRNVGVPRRPFLC